jgi:ADP-ribosyl-[dinitrogen reductase] hydrolase
MEQHELTRYGVAGLGAAVAARGMAWLHLPIVDVDIPRAPFEAAWVTAGPRLHGWLREGRRVLLHCKGGLGRTGTIACLLLIEQGMQPDAAIRAVRAARDGTIETPAQVAWVRARTPG